MTSRPLSPVPLSPQGVRLCLGLPLDPMAEPTPVVLQGPEASAHKLVLGVTGAGKSAFLATLFVQLLNQGVSVLLIDPHGDLCLLILATLLAAGFFAHAAAFQRLWYVDFAHPQRALPWNVLRRPWGEDAHTTAQHLLEAWRRAWPAISMGGAPLLETVVLAGCYVLAEHELPLTALGRLLSDPPFRETLLSRVPDQEVATFLRQFTASGRRAANLAESTLRRAFLLTFNPLLRDCLGQTANRLDLRALMNGGVSLLCNLGGLDAETQRFLGCLLTVQMEVAALARSELPASARRPVHILIDEWPVFASRSATALEHLLAQSRKYGVSLTLACQTWGQTRGLQSALQNATQLITFRLGPDDAAWAAPRLFTPDPYRIKHVVEDPYRAASAHPLYMSLHEQRAEWEAWLQQLPPRHAYVRGDGRTTRFQTLLLPPSHHPPQMLEALKEEYARRLLTPRPSLAGEGLAARFPQQLPVGVQEGLQQPPNRAGAAPRLRLPHQRVAPLANRQQTEANEEAGEEDEG